MTLPKPKRYGDVCDPAQAGGDRCYDYNRSLRCSDQGRCVCVPNRIWNGAKCQVKLVKDTLIYTNIRRRKKKTFFVSLFFFQKASGKFFILLYNMLKS
jgi:hypothetical protein